MPQEGAERGSGERGWGESGKPPQQKKYLTSNVVLKLMISILC